MLRKRVQMHAFYSRDTESTTKASIFLKGRGENWSPWANLPLLLRAHLAQSGTPHSRQFTSSTDWFSWDLRWGGFYNYNSDYIICHIFSSRVKTLQSFSFNGGLLHQLRGHKTIVLQYFLFPLLNAYYINTHTHTKKVGKLSAFLVSHKHVNV